MNAPATTSLPRQFSNTAPDHENIPVPNVKVWLFDQSGRFPKQQIELDAELTSEGYWLVSHPEILTHGTGDTIPEAIADFHSMLFDLLDELVESEDVLASNLKRQLDYLRTLLVEQPLP